MNAEISALGDYEILGILGAGGMGRVYRALDKRLGRIVAIKVMLPDVAKSPGFEQRFFREGKLVAGLNHPHICTLYDIGQQDDLHYIVMELLEGESFASRLNRGPLPVSEVLRIGIQIADALSHAHRRGIVHRDLKPGNIMYTKLGPKIVDFGLAKRQHPAGISTSQTDTMVTAKTFHPGTPAYMAPERWDNKDADKRSDLFSFGAVLYEMLTGRKAFEGHDESSVEKAIRTSEPQPLANVPVAVERLVGHCLAKDPDERWQDAHDVALALGDIADARRKR